MMPERENPTQSVVVITLANSVSQISFCRKTVRLIEKIWLGKFHIGVSPQSSRAEVSTKILPCSGKCPVAEKFSDTGWRIGDIKVSLFKRQIATDAAVAVDADAHADFRRMCFLNFHQQIAPVRITALDRRDRD